MTPAEGGRLSVWGQLATRDPACRARGRSVPLRYRPRSPGDAYRRWSADSDGSAVPGWGHPPTPEAAGGTASEMRDLRSALTCSPPAYSRMAPATALAHSPKCLTCACLG